MQKHGKAISTSHAQKSTVPRSQPERRVDSKGIARGEGRGGGFDSSQKKRGGSFHKHRLLLSHIRSSVSDYKTSKRLENKDCGNRVSDSVYVQAEPNSLASSLININTVYEFRLAGHSTISTDGSGVINGFFACDPSSAGLNFPEWNSLTVLFSEFRLKSLSVQFVPRAGTAGIKSALAVAGNLGTAAAPSAFANLTDNADCKYVVWNTTTPLGYTHTLHGTDLNWSQVTSPTTEPYAGAPGSIQYYMESSQTSTVHYDCMVWGIYQFRSRV